MTKSAPTQALEVEQRLVASLIPYAHNPRKHSRQQIDQIVASVREFGWTAPILVDGDRGIIAGHGRLAAARKMRMTTVPVIELSGLSEAQRRAYLIADNQLAIDAGWDFDVLRGEAAELRLADYDLDILGFPDVDEMMGEKVEKPKTERDPRVTKFQFDIIFETEEQRRTWFVFLRGLKGKYPDTETMGERISRFLSDGGCLGPR